MRRTSGESCSRAVGRELCSSLRLVTRAVIGDGRAERVVAARGRLAVLSPPATLKMDDMTSFGKIVYERWCVDGGEIKLKGLGAGRVQ